MAGFGDFREEEKKQNKKTKGKQKNKSIPNISTYYRASTKAEPKNNGNRTTQKPFYNKVAPFIDTKTLVSMVAKNKKANDLRTKEKQINENFYAGRAVSGYKSIPADLIHYVDKKQKTDHANVAHDKWFSKLPRDKQEEINSGFLNKIDKSANKSAQNFITKYEKDLDKQEFAVSKGEHNRWLSDLAFGGSRLAGESPLIAAGGAGKKIGGTIGIVPRFLSNLAEAGTRPSTMYYTAANQGRRYHEALKEGATQEEAIKSAEMYGYPSAVIEGLGGAQSAITKAMGKRLGGSLVGNLIKGAGSEVLEGFTQTPLENISKLHYKKMPILSMDKNKEAIVNPRQMAYSATIDATLGALGGGVGVAINKAVPQRPTNTDTIMANKPNGMGDFRNVAESVQKSPNVNKDMGQIIQEYHDAVDDNLVKFYKEVNKGNVESKAYYPISKVDIRTGKEINEILGINPTGYSVEVNPSAVKHIEKRHGVSGIADHSMADTKDFGRIKYVVENYDSMKQGGKSREWRNSDGSFSDTIVYSKRVNGTYYIVEAVNDSKSKILHIVSAYKTKADQLVPDVPKNPESDVRNEPTASASNNIIPNLQGKVNQPVGENNENLFNEEKIANVSARTEKERLSIKQNVQKATDWLQKHFINSGYAIDRIANKTGNQTLKHRYNNVGQSLKTVESMVTESQSDFDGRKVGKSLVDIFDKVRNDGDEYYNKLQTFLFDMHNDARMQQEKPIFGESVTSDKSTQEAAELLAEHPEFADIAEDVYNYNKNNMQYRVDSGLISQKQADYFMEKYPYYVPTYRKMPETSGITSYGGNVSVNDTIKEAKGSNLDLVPLHEQMVNQTSAIVYSGRINKLLNELYDTLPNAAKSIVKDGSGYNIETESLETMPFQVDKDNNVTFYRNGEKVSMKVDDGVAFGIQQLIPKDNNIKVLHALNSGFKNLVTTYNPLFTIANAVRDVGDAGLYSEKTSGFAVKYPQAWGHIVKNSEVFQVYKALGGFGSSFFDNGNSFDYKEHNIIRKITLDNIDKANYTVEQAPRFAEFLNVLQQVKKERGDTTPLTKDLSEFNGDELQKSMYAAADITVNFGRNGDWGK